MRIRKFIIVFGICLLILASCTKLNLDKKLPELQNQAVVELTQAQIEWLEQIAKIKSDSINQINQAESPNDANSLFKKKNLMIGLVDINDHYFSNINCYLDSNNKPIFDLVFPSSANINISAVTGKAFIYYNPELNAMLNNGSIKLVQASGILVGLSLIGDVNDEKAWDNFSNLADATSFAQLVAYEVRTHKFAAVLTYDGFSDYQPGWSINSNSYLKLLSELKKLLPDVLLCNHDDFAFSTALYDGNQLGDIADADFQDSNGPYFNNYNFSTNKIFLTISEQLSYGFKDPFNDTKRYQSQGIGGEVFYNIQGLNSSPYFYIPYLKALKGTSLNVPSGCLIPTIKDFINGY